MKVVTILAIVSVVIFSGCQSNTNIRKTFYGGKISYTLTPKAQQSIGTIVGLLERSYEEEGIEPPLPDGIILPIYVAADANRDHKISNKEAKIFEKQGILEFESQLGGMRFKPRK